jgi:hypothetical protein
MKYAHFSIIWQQILDANLMLKYIFREALLMTHFILAKDRTSRDLTGESLGTESFKYIFV